MFRLLQATDKEQMLTLVTHSQMFSEDEQAFIADTFDNVNEQAIWFGAFDGEVMTGVAYCMPEEMTNATWNVLMLLVHPEHHSKGIGKGLMRLMEQTLSEQSQRLLLVETSSTDDFTTARAFYNAIGYSQQGVIEHYYDDNDHKVTFIKKL